MNIFKRLNATFIRHIESAASYVENHDAIVEAALKDTRAASAKARVRLSRIRKDVEAMRRKTGELEAAEKNWAERARNMAASNEATALECVKRRNAARVQLAQISESLKKHEELEQEVGASVERIESRISELTLQRNRMRSRHSAADALRMINRIENTSSHGIEDIFDRWEMQITEAEYENGEASPVDALDLAFIKEESTEALKADLAALLAEEKE